MKLQCISCECVAKRIEFPKCVSSKQSLLKLNFTRKLQRCFEQKPNQSYSEISSRIFICIVQITFYFQCESKKPHKIVYKFHFIFIKIIWWLSAFVWVFDSKFKVSRVNLRLSLLFCFFSKILYENYQKVICFTFKWLIRVLSCFFVLVLRQKYYSLCYLSQITDILLFTVCLDINFVIIQPFVYLLK